MGGMRDVLCAVDFSEGSRRALDYAVAVARWYRCRLTLMHVYHVPTASMAFGALMPPVSEGVMLSSAERDQLRHDLVALLPSAAADPLSTECVIAEGDVAGEILAQAASADLIVLGTHGRTGFEHLLLGSVAERVVRQATCPVLTIPRTAPDAVEGIRSLFHQMVAAVDFSEASTAALRFAVTLAEDADAHLTLLQVMEVPRELAEWAETSADGRQHIEQWRAQATARLRLMVPDAQRHCCHIEERVVVGRPYREILRVAAEQRAGLIVVGRHGHGAFDRLFLGSTVLQILRGAACPVLTVRAPASGE